jgi:FkbM family methyltransferase
MIYQLQQVPIGQSRILWTRPGSSDDAAVIREIFTENVYRLALSDCEGTVIDIGANIGAFSVYAALHGAERVIAVEPEPDNLRVLAVNQETLPDPGVITVWPRAIWASLEDVRLTPNQGGTRVTPDGAVTVRGIPLSFLLSAEHVTECATLKLDIEGSEYAVLCATPSALLARVRYLTMEFHSTDAATFGALIAYLTRTHAVQTLGSYERGGYIFARIY